MSFVEQEVSFIVSSDPDAGAINRTPDGSSFEIQLQDGLKIPKDAVNVSVSVEESTIWWVVPNIIEDVNDKIYIFGDNDDEKAPVAQLFTVQIPQGLYDISGLNQAIISGLEAQGAKTVEEPLITLQPDEATQRVKIRFNYDNVYVDFSQPNTFHEILGFEKQQYGPYPSSPIDILAPNTAAFNTVNYFLITSDLVQKGIRFNNRYAQVISQVLINVSPGSQIVSTPFNPAKTASQELAGTIRSNLRFNLTDDKLRPVNTNGEYWSARIVIKYHMPMVIGKMDIG